MKPRLATPADLARLKRRERGSKFRNKPCVVDGIRFASKAEARHWCVLKMLERSGKIERLCRQVKFDLGSGITYRADFTYWDIDLDRFMVVDVKGVETKEFKLKAKLFEAWHGFPITVVKA